MFRATESFLMKRTHQILCLLAAGGALFGLRHWVTAAVGVVAQKVAPRKTIADRLAEYGRVARERWAPHFAKAGVAYPPAALVLVGIKAENRLEVYAGAEPGKVKFIRDYPIRAASGELGPKLKEGDGQVPEGIYQIESLNPNSRFHLSLRVNYPNRFDREQAAREGRTNLGGDIMIHGNAVSIGCLAMGDVAAEDLFVLAADTGLKNISVLLTPVDFRTGKRVPSSVPLPAWTEKLYADLRTELGRLPKRK